MVRAIDLFGVIVVSLVMAASAGAQDTHENPDRGLTITIRTDATAGAPAAQTIRLYSNSTPSSSASTITPTGGRV